MRFVNVEELVNLERPGLAMIVHGLVPKPSHVILMGAPKAGKSFLAIELGRAVASGEDFLGHKTKQSRVLYLQLDNGEAVWRGILERLVESGVRFPPGLVFPHPDDERRPLNLLDPMTRSYLKTVLKESDPELVILDVYREIHNADENDSTEMKAVNDVITEIFSDRALFLLHHAKKIPADVNASPTSASRGSTYITGKADALWYLRTNEDGTQGTLKVESRIGTPETYRLARLESGLWVASDVESRREQIARLHSLCREFPKRTHNTLADLARERWKYSKSLCYRVWAANPCPTHVILLKTGVSQASQPSVGNG